MDKDQILTLAIKSKRSDGSVDIIQVARKVGIEVFEADDNTINAEIRYLAPDKFEIVVNTDHSLNRQRFSIAHELAHFILHRDVIQDMGSMNRAPTPNNQELSQMEEAADSLAGELLMPELLIQEFLLQIPLDNRNPLQVETVQIIANKFKVSIVAAAIRLRTLGLQIPYISFSFAS